MLLTVAVALFSRARPPPMPAPPAWPLAPAPPIAEFKLSALLLSATLPPLLKMPPPMPAPPAPPMAWLLMMLLESTLSVPRFAMPPPATAELLLTLVPVTVVEQREALYRPPPFVPAELPLMVQLVSVAVPGTEPILMSSPLDSPPPLVVAESPTTVQLVSVVVPGNAWWKVATVSVHCSGRNNEPNRIFSLGGKFSVTDLGRRLDETTGPFLDTAAVLKNLDLFITSDTAMVHLAGALGVPVWMALSTTPDWRWMTHREDNPWYSTSHLPTGYTHGVGPGFRADGRGAPRAGPGEDANSLGDGRNRTGELIDKITILEIKAERITDPENLRNVRVELAAMSEARIVQSSIEMVWPPRRSISKKSTRRYGISKMRSAMRDAGDFGLDLWSSLARSTRTATVRDGQAVDQQRLSSQIIEEKSYKAAASVPTT